MSTLLRCYVLMCFPAWQCHTTLHVPNLGTASSPPRCSHTRIHIAPLSELHLRPLVSESPTPLPYISTHQKKNPGCGSPTRKVSWIFVHRWARRNYRLARALTSCISIEIGVALTTFGGLFMLLGVMLFFDGALLALGNVRLVPQQTIPPTLPECQTQLTIHARMNARADLLIPCAYNFTDPLHFGFDVDHWASEDFLLFRQKTEDPRDDMFLGRHPSRLSQVAVYWNDCGDIWISESLRVCVASWFMDTSVVNIP